MNASEQPRALSELIAYQDGSIVSRALIAKPAGTVTLFAFDRGEGLSEHTAPYDALVFLLEGRMAITIAGQMAHLASGDYLLLPANQPHALQADDPSKILLIMIRE